MKGFVKDFEAPQRIVKIKTYVDFFFLSGIKTEIIQLQAKVQIVIKNLNKSVCTKRRRKIKKRKTNE